MKNKTRPPKKALISRTQKPDDLTLEQWQVALRRQFASIQSFRLKNIGQHEVFSEFIVTNPSTKRTYRVAIRSGRLGDNFCSCPDFSVNTLGTCKHVEFVLARLGRKRKYKAMLEAGCSLPYEEVFLRYGPRRQVIFRLGDETPVALKTLADHYFDKDGILREDAFERFADFMQKAKRMSSDIRCYDDALVFIAEVRDAKYRKERLDQKFLNGIQSKSWDNLLKTAIYPYQRQGALFAAKAGRSLIADDMGLGKTVQAIAATEILAGEFGVQKVLIICPTSLKYQWKTEIEKFCARPVSIIEGPSHIRRQSYRTNAFFKIVNYNVVHRDLEEINRMSPDLIILDEAQRIKNWKTRVAQNVKQIKSPYAIVLTGTPLENRLEELYSIVEFVDRFRLGPLFRFLSKHQETDPESGKVTGYRELNSISQTLSSILVRRTKADVLLQLPERMDKNFFVPMTPQQMNIHEENREIVAQIVNKWIRYKFLTEADQRRLMVALQYMRMSCNNTYLIDQKTRFGKKIDEMGVLLEEIFEDKSVKVVIFSQWQRMTSLVAEALERKSWGYVDFHGGVPGNKRKDLIKTFYDDSSCRVFLSTDAGGVGLNLQSASVVVNLDLPWNPAVLEQRIGRVHRLGQHKPVRVINFVAQHTIEHNMLEVLRFKKSLFTGVLDKGEDSVFIGKSRIAKFMESVQQLTDVAKDNGIDSQQMSVHGPTTASPRPLDAHRQDGDDQQLVMAGFSLLKVLAQGLSEHIPSIENDPKTNQPCLKFPLPNKQALASALPAVESLLSLLKKYAQ